MTERDITKCMQEYVDHQDMSGGALLVRKNGELVYRNLWGEACIDTHEPITYDSIYRMMSMTKCVTAVCVMQLVEQGKIGLDDAVSKYIPEFHDMQVVADERYVIDMKNIFRDISVNRQT